jgi:thiamine biosynthesis lipoprotein
MLEHAPAPVTVLLRQDAHWLGRFKAMASPCELLIDHASHREATELLERAAAEALRIEHKFSRYRADGIVSQINTSSGRTIEVDNETAQLLDYAAECWNISEGLFDITTGILRRVWKFDGGNQLPSSAEIAELLSRIGWDKVGWAKPLITLPAGMEIDLGGIGKEYAVDRTASLIRTHTQESFVVNYGGDLYISGPRSNGEFWTIGVDDPEATGIRYSHILNPKTGWPIVAAPRAVTVIAETCVEAGTLSTFAMLQGSNAEAFLNSQGVKHWISR